MEQSMYLNIKLYIFCNYSACFVQFSIWKDGKYYRNALKLPLSWLQLTTAEDVFPVFLKAVASATIGLPDKCGNSAFQWPPYIPFFCLSLMDCGQGYLIYHKHNNTYRIVQSLSGPHVIQYTVKNVYWSSDENDYAYFDIWSLCNSYIR